MDAFQFSEEEKKRLEKFVEIYSKTKIVIIKAEESNIDLVKFFHLLNSYEMLWIT